MQNSGALVQKYTKIHKSPEYVFQMLTVPVLSAAQVQPNFRILVLAKSRTSCTKRICASLGLRMKLKTLFMSDDKKHGHHFNLPLFLNTSKQFLAPGGLSAECVQVSVM